TNVLLDDAGTVQAQRKYEAFGQVDTALDWANLSVSGWAGMSVDDWANLPVEGLAGVAGAFTQKQYYLDAETELYLLGSGGDGRHYDPTTARFLREDPIRHVGSEGNLFRYVENDPINRIDPSGFDDNDGYQEIQKM